MTVTQFEIVDGRRAQALGGARKHAVVMPVVDNPLAADHGFRGHR